MVGSAIREEEERARYERAKCRNSSSQNLVGRDMQTYSESRAWGRVKLVTQGVKLLSLP